MTDARALPPAPDAPHWLVKIDYLSMTSRYFHVPRIPDLTSELGYETDGARVLSALGLSAFVGSDPPAWPLSFGRSGYTRSTAHPVGARLFSGSHNAPPLLELGGAACDHMSRYSELLPLIRLDPHGVTRLDLAGDLVTSLSPEEFLAYGRSPRHASSGGHDSATGSTRYVGSKTSQRFVKVYRYYEPHPRADALRVEVTLKAELAKSAAEALLTADATAVYRAACEPFSFKCPQWRLPDSSVSLRGTLPNEKSAAGRLRWLEKQIRPVAIEAHRAGLIDLSAWLAEAD